MAVIWHKTNFLGVRYREHAERKHTLKPDRCFSIRYKVDGKDKEEVAGWWSAGMTAEKAYKLLSDIRDNIRLGMEPRSIAAMRLENEQRTEEKRRAQRRAEQDAITFADFWNTEYLPAAEATKTPRSFNSEKFIYANWVAPALGDIPLQKIDPAKAEALALHAMKAGKSAQTVRHILGIVSRVWNKAWTRGLVQGDNPTRRVKKPRQDNRRTRFLSQEEARKLLAELATRSIDIHDEAVLALFCGLRAGEIHSLAWGDIDLENGTILIRDPKNKNNRHAFITQEVKTLLERRDTKQTKNVLLFPGTNGKQRQWVSKSFERAVDALGLNNTGEFTTGENGDQIPVKIQDARQRVVFHSLRHTFASWLVQRGEPLYTVAKLMGHTTLEMTQRYSHLAPDSLRKAALSLEGSLEQKSAKIIPFQTTGA